MLEAATVGAGNCSLPTPSYVTAYSFLLTAYSFLRHCLLLLLRATHCYALLRYCLLHCYSFLPHCYSLLWHCLPHCYSFLPHCYSLLPHCYSLLTAGGIHLSVVSSGLSLPM